MTTAPPCVSGCTFHNRHLDGCEDQEKCRGCLPRPATQGRLCDRCIERAEQHLINLPRMWADLAEHLPPGSAAGNAKVSGTPEKRIGMAVGPADARLAIERRLAYWVVVLARAAGHHWPQDHRNPAVSAPWLHLRLPQAAASQWADLITAELADLTRTARGLLNPTGRRRITAVGPCPEQDCPGTLTASIAAADELLPAALTCDKNPEHTYTTRDWRKLGLKMGKEAA